jgi:hypothetical protein
MCNPDVPLIGAIRSARLQHVQASSIMDPLAAPMAITLSGQAMANQDYGPRGPQVRPGAQLDAPLNGR